MRAFSPVPGARTLLKGAPVKVWRAYCVGLQGTPGSVLESGADGIVIGCGEGALRVIELQKAGGNRLAAADFLRGCPIEPGERLGAAR